jgi:serine/threonine-protein kinase RsbW
MTAERQNFPARTDALAAVTAFVERRCAALRVGRRASLRLQLVVEELFINTVVHGYGGDSADTITLTVRSVGPEIELIAEDTAMAFDPFANVPARDDPLAGPVGGLGRVLIAGMASRHAYERRGRHNRVTVGVLKGRLVSRRKPKKK